VQWQLLFFSMFPILAFAVVETISNRRNAVASAIVVSAAEFAFNSHQLGFLEVFSAISLLLFLALGVASLRSGRIVIFKFQPVLMGLLWAGAFWIHDARSGDRLLALILERHVRVNELIPPYQRGYFAGYAATMSRSLPFLLVFHAGLTAYAALKLSTWWWFGIRTVGFHLLVLGLFFAERLFSVSY
jgi:intracellular septation protein A